MEAMTLAYQECYSEFCMAEDIQPILEGIISLFFFLVTSNKGRKYSAARHALLGSEGLQQYAMEGLGLAALGKVGVRGVLPEDAACILKVGIQTLHMYLMMAAKEGTIAETRLGALVTHAGILAALRAAAGGLHNFIFARRCSSESIKAAWHFFSVQRRQPGGSREAHVQAQLAMLESMRQAGTLLQLSALAPAHRQRAERRARRHGFLEVHF